MTAIATFVELIKKNLVKLPSPANGDDVQDIEQEAEAAEEQADAAELQARAAADKARIMERLSALIGPYKQAVACNGAHAKRLQALFHTIKASVEKQQFTEAGEGLDMLEDLVDKQSAGTHDDDHDVPVHKHHKHVEEDDADAQEHKHHKHEADDDDDDEPSRKHGMGLELDDDDEPLRKHGIGLEDQDNGSPSKHALGVDDDVDEPPREYGLDVDKVDVPPHKYSLGVDDADAPPSRHGLGVEDEQRAPPEAAVGDTNSETGGLDPTDIIPEILKDLVKELASPQKVTGKIANLTKQTLILDQQSVEKIHGEYNKFPPDEIKPGAEDGEFVATSSSTADLTLEGVTGEVKYFLDDKKETFWTLAFNNPHSGDNDAKGSWVTGPDWGQYEHIAHAGQGREAVFTYTLKSKAKPPPPPGPAVNLSCRITVTNKTKYTLTLKNMEGDKIGDWIQGPDKEVLKPEDSTSCVFGQTTNEKEKSKLIKGSLLWEVGMPGSPPITTWRCAWVNPVGEKNTVDHGFDPDTKEFDSPDEIDDGDENVPVKFRLLSRGQQPPPPPEDPDEEYKPPKPEKQPTLTMKKGNDPDGWVEYLQEQLNEQLTDQDIDDFKKQFPVTQFKLPVDGNFSKDVYNAVKIFQSKAKKSNPSFIVDGIVGDQTWAALRHGTPEKPNVRGHKNDTGFKARWLTEDEVCTYVKSSDTISLKLCSVGTVDLEGKVASVFVTPPNGTRVGKPAHIGKPREQTQTGEGNVHEATVANCDKAFRLQGVDLKTCQIEAYFDQDLGGDRWFYHPGKGGLKEG